MTRRVARALLVLAGALAMTSREAVADIVSRFGSNAEGWRVVSFTDLTANDYTILGTTGVTHHATGGNPGGFISAADPDNGDFTFSAPTKFLGDESGATGLSYDLTYDSGVDHQTTDVILVGNGTRLLWKSDPDIVPGAGWTSVSLDFTPSANWRVGTTDGALASAADFQGVLGDLTGIFIRGEFTNGLVETAGLDNARLRTSSVPEPGSLALLALAVVPGVLILGNRGRRAEGPMRCQVRGGISSPVDHDGCEGRR